MISPFKSVKQVASELVGSLLSNLVPDIFENEIAIRSVNCPLLIVHGQKDELIKYSHAESLFN